MGAFETIRKSRGDKKSPAVGALGSASEGALLLEKRFKMGVPTDSSVSFWVDTHCCLELLQVAATASAVS